MRLEGAVSKRAGAAISARHSRSGIRPSSRAALAAQLLGVLQCCMPPRAGPWPGW